MMTSQLIEQAVLSAMGLLEPEEQDAYDRALEAASPAIQAIVRRERERLSDITPLLPDEEPPAELRGKVLSAVREAMRERANNTAPARQTTHAASDKVVAAGAVASGRVPVPALKKSRRVSPLWRVTAFGLVAATMVMGVVMGQMQQEYSSLGDVAFTSKLLDDVGYTRVLHDMVFDESTQKAVMFTTEEGAASGFQGSASVMHNSDWSKARVFYQGFPTGTDDTFSVVAVDDDGNIASSLGSFTPRGGFASVEVDVSDAVGMRVAIVSSSPDGERTMLVMSTDRLA